MCHLTAFPPRRRDQVKAEIMAYLKMMGEVRHISSRAPFPSLARIGQPLAPSHPPSTRCPLACRLALFNPCGVA